MVSQHYVENIQAQIINWLEANAYERVNGIRAERIGIDVYRFTVIKGGKEHYTDIALPCNAATVAMATATIYNKIHDLA